MHGRARLPSPPLVGRRDELALLADALDRAKAGRGHTIFLAGEGGVGKTRLATMAAERASEAGFTIAIGRGYPVETGVPYALFADALVPIFQGIGAAQLAMLTRGLGSDIGRLFPVLAPEGRGAPDAGRGRCCRTTTGRRC